MTHYTSTTGEFTLVLTINPESEESPAVGLVLVRRGAFITSTTACRPCRERVLGHSRGFSLGVYGDLARTIRRLVQLPDGSFLVRWRQMMS